MSKEKQIVVRCVARGNDEIGWDAICLDFDIAVHANTLTEARELLDSALETYVEDACKEDDATCSRLLARKAPFWVRLKWGTNLFLHQVMNNNSRREQSCTASFDLLCPA